MARSRFRLAGSRLALIFVFGIAALLVACGGGDDEDAQAQSESASSAPAQTEDAQTEDAQTEPAEDEQSQAEQQAEEEELPVNDGDEPAQEQAQEEDGQQSADAGVAGELTDSDDGDFVLGFAEPSEAYRPLAEALIESGVFETVIAVLNNQLLLPRSIDVVFQECGAINAFYDPESVSIAVCYELVEWLVQNFSQIE